MTNRKLRLCYIGAALLLLLSLFLIAGTSGFLRGTVGDLVVVLFLYAAARAVKPRGLRILPLLIFLLALTVEILQSVDILGLLGIRNETLQIAVGSVFDWMDIVAYAAGCAVAAGADWLVERWTMRKK